MSAGTESLIEAPDQNETVFDRWVAKFATRDQMARAYACVMVERGLSWKGYPALNLAIIDRWSESGLVYIKTEAWKLVGSARV